MKGEWEMVFRCFSVKKPGFDVEASKVLRDLREDLGILALTGVRIFNRYDVEGVSEQAYARGLTSVFSEPQCDDVYREVLPELEGPHSLLAVEALPGQYDQRADSCCLLYTSSRMYLMRKSVALRRTTWTISGSS